MVLQLTATPTQMIRQVTEGKQEQSSNDSSTGHPSHQYRGGSFTAQLESV